MSRITGFTSFTPKSATARAVLASCFFGLIGFVLFLIFFFNAPVYSLAIPITPAIPEQPIPYSHKLHAGDLEINCIYCHSYARRSEMAGVPSVSRCMGCHNNLSIESAPILKLTEYFEKANPIDWIRIYDLPDFVWFSHKRHIAKDIACQKCHGPVETLEINKRLVTHKMGFCLNCHQDREASTDCLTCHM